MIGAAAMGWGGSALDSRLGLEGWHSADLAIFAVGIILLGQLPALLLRQRVRELEAALKQRDSNVTLAAS
jgi:hypothetical protein